VSGGWRMFRAFSSVRGRIIAGFGFLVLILVAVAGGSAWQVREHRFITAAMEERADTAFMLQNALVNAEAAASGVQRYVMIGGETPVAGDEDLLPRIRSDMAEAEESLAQAIVQEEIQGDEEQIARLYQISAEADSLIAGVEMLIALQESGDAQAAAAGLEVAVLPFREFEEKLEAAAETELHEVSALRNRVDRAGDLALWLLIISGATGAFLGLATSVFVARSIIKPLSSLEATAIAISQGDLEARTQATGPRELARLGSALNQMTDSLLDASKRRELEEALRQSEERLRTVVASTPIVMFSLDSEGVFLLAEGRGLESLGFRASDVLGQNIFEQSRDMPQVLQSVRRALTGESFTTLLDVNGRVLEAWLCPVRDQSGDISSITGVVTDVTDRKRAEEQLIRQRAVLGVINKVLREALICDTDADMARACVEAAEELTASKFGFIGEINEAGRFDTIALTDPGWGACRVPRSSAARLIKDMEIRGLWGKVVKDENPLIVNDPASHPDRVGTPEGHPPLTSFLGVPLKRGNKTIGMIGLANKESGYDAADQEDIEALSVAFVEALSRKRAEETIKHLAYHDALTDLPNRMLFRDRLTVALAQARRAKRMLAVMFLDLDHFKVVNDTAGHEGGDKLLLSVARRLGGLVREGDTVARVGGDEFAILSSEIAHVEDAPEVAERILEGLRRPWVVQGQEFHVSTSIGIAMYPSDGDDAESLLRNADTAMYRAKERGRDNYQLFTPAMNATIAERLAVEGSLRRGLERGEFVVHYQPQVNLRSGQVVGTEALVRWQHPDRGLVPPAEFIPVAEDTGLIVPLGEWVLRTACAQNRAWQEDGLPPLRVAVNLSARQFQQRNLIDMVAQVLEDTGMDPHCLQLEITEDVAMQDVDITIAVLRSLRAMGVEIAMDDFGTGYSSLSYLKRLPVSAVKIDRSFVRDLTIDPNDAEIVAAVIAMAHNLKLNVIAEGVETEEQFALLKQRDCDEMQGYLFSRPAPTEAIEELLKGGGRWSRSKIAIDSPLTRSVPGAANELRASTSPVGPVSKGGRRYVRSARRG